MTEAWLLLAVGDDRQHGGNDGYDDEPDSYYSWDSTVPNHAALHVGDVVVLWDKKSSLGMSVIEEMYDPIVEEKPRYTCPACQRANIKARKTGDDAHRYRCYSCKSVFAEPDARIDRVTKYRARHDASWVPLDGVFTGAELRSLATSPKSQLSLRPLDWMAFERALDARNLREPARQVAARSDLRVPEGHVQVLTRARVGQGSFRRSLLQRFGATCAVTGPQPEEALEAAHLYSYAAVGQHHEHGGLLLRRDVHHLFDSGALAVDPDSLEISLTGRLLGFDAYAQYEGAPLRIRANVQQRGWLRAHWSQHRTAT